jgi:anti-anti-sigma regulatory factor
VGFLGSPGFGKLLMFYKNFTSKEGKIKVVSLKNEVAALFKSIQLDKLFSCSDLE